MMMHRLLKIYISFVKFYRSFSYYQLLNLRSKVKINFRTTPNFQQRTFITGLGTLNIGSNCVFGYLMGGFHYGGSIEIQPRTNGAVITIGDNVETNNNLFLSSCNMIRIGDDTLIGQNVCIMDYEAHGHQPSLRRIVGEIGSVVIGRNVWIGNNVVILKNSVIGENSIVAAGAVVAGEFPNNVIIGGVPAKIIKNL